LKPGFLIYGKGKSILKSLSFTQEVPGLDGGDPPTRYLYFGDLDWEGIGIYNRLVKRYPERELLPWLEGYMALLRLTNEAPRLRRQQRPTDLEPFIRHFGTDARERIEGLLKSGSYIPQEALNLAVVRQLARTASPSTPTVP